MPWHLNTVDMFNKREELILWHLKSTGTWRELMLEKYWYMKIIIETFDSWKKLILEKYSYLKNIDTFDTRKVLVLLILEKYE